MTFPPPPPSAQSSIASSSDKLSSVRVVRPQQTAWGAPGQQPGARRGLTPLSTTDLTSPSAPVGSPSRRLTGANNTAQNPSAASPLSSTFSSVLTTSHRLGANRNNPSPSTTASPFTANQSGSHQAPQSAIPGISSPRSRALTPSSASQFAPGVTPINTSTGGGGGSGPGGGGSTRNTPFSPPLSGTNTISSPTASTFEKSSTLVSGSNLASGQSSLSKISVAQVFLLLDSITEKEGKAKWESKAEQIRKVSKKRLMDP